MCVAIKVENVSKTFGETVVLSNVNIEFEKGKVHGLIGRNGSGKENDHCCLVVHSNQA